LVGTGSYFRGAYHRIEAALMQDAAHADGYLEIGWTKRMDDKWQLAFRMPVQNCDQTPSSIPLNAAFGGDPVGAARPAGIFCAMYNIEDHGARRCAEVADWRARGGLGDGGGDGEEASDEKECAERSCEHEDGPLGKKMRYFGL
jgi:hypothetical protein